MRPKFEIYTKIQRPVSQVFDAVYNPKKLSKYFTTGGARGSMDRGATVTWDFADFPGAFPVTVKESRKNRQIEFEWSSAETGRQNRVRMVFKRLGPQNTKVTVSESGWTDSPRGRKGSYDNCWGWAQMLSCMKAYLEYGINLRKGAY